MDTKEAYTTHQAAEILGISYRTIQEWIKHGKFPHAYKLDPTSVNRSHLRIPIEDIKRIQDMRKQSIIKE
jgi:excisionase family DNA binding protein